MRLSTRKNKYFNYFIIFILIMTLEMYIIIFYIGIYDTLGKIQKIFHIIMTFILIKVIRQFVDEV